MMNKTSYKMARSSRTSLPEETKTVALWTEKLESVYCFEVDEHEDELVVNEILDLIMFYTKIQVMVRVGTTWLTQEWRG